VRTLAWESIATQWFFEIATPVCALVRNDNEEKQQLDKLEFEGYF
jgi:hypothetical protein